MAPLDFGGLLWAGVILAAIPFIAFGIGIGWLIWG